MKIIQNAATAAILAVLALSPVSAIAQTRVPVTARIETADLDLSRPAGRASLNRRLATAARRACGHGNIHWQDLADAQRCYREMMADGTRKIAAIAGDPVVQVASIDRR